ncbi:MAG: hypothetical protein H0X24_09145 [Ktedonobacterales bacterium]|nr:hypothetical protein [Ktedonobacterales bacterium]
MNHCEYCGAPLLSITKVCPNCHREQPPYPPVLPGGGGRSYSGWALILTGLSLFMLVLGIAMYWLASYSNASAWIYGSPDSYINTGSPAYLGSNPSAGDQGWIPGNGYLIFFGGIALVLGVWAVISYNRGRRIDKANAALLETLQNSN